MPAAAFACEQTLLGMCLVEPAKQSGGIFGFAEFVQALALLVIVYTVTDVRYRFRLSTAPLPLWPLTFIVTALIGVGTLLTDVLFSLQIPVPNFLHVQALWQASLGVLFLLTAMTWIWYAFIRSPIFGRRNYKKYVHTLYRYILQGSNSELPIIGAELSRSADALIALAREIPYPRPPGSPIPDPVTNAGPSEFANDLMLLIGNRKFCRHIVAEAPGTAIAIFDAMSRQKKYRLPLGQFASNITTEALINKDSMLYHEDAGYFSGLIGYLKPFSNALYGDFKIVEALAEMDKSPLDLSLQLRFSWDAEQVEAYGRAILIAFEAYLDGGHWGQHSYALTRAFADIEGASGDAYKLDGNESAPYSTDIYKRLSAVVDFVKDCIKILDKQDNSFRTKLRHRGEREVFQEDMYDRIAHMIFEIILDASAVKSPVDTCWTIQHNAVWSEFFGLYDGKAWKIVRFKLRRLLYNEILKLGEFPNYKSARFLGVCLNVMGLSIGNRSGYERSEYALRKAVIGWTKKNYLNVRGRLPDVATACLMGGITFDEENHRLVKTYMKGLSLEAPKRYLDLELPVPQRETDSP